MDVHRLHRRARQHHRRDPRRHPSPLLPPRQLGNHHRLVHQLPLLHRLRPHIHNPLRHLNGHLQRRFNEIQHPRLPRPQHLRDRLDRRRLLPRLGPFLALQLVLLQREEQSDQRVW